MKRQLRPYIILFIIRINRKANLYLRKIENIEISSFFIIGLIVDKGGNRFLIEKLFKGSQFPAQSVPVVIS